VHNVNFAQNYFVITVKLIIMLKYLTLLLIRYRRMQQQPLF